MDPVYMGNLVADLNQFTMPAFARVHVCTETSLRTANRFDMAANQFTPNLVYTQPVSLVL